MEKIKKYWKEILICLLIIFGLNKCTVACNRDSKINKQNIELVQRDSIIKVQTDSLNILNVRWDENQKGQANYQNLATGTKQDLENQVTQLTSENNNLNDKINQLISEINKLKKENSQLKEQLNNN